MKKVSEQMTPADGVFRRPGSGIWQWGIKAPVALRGLYKTQWAHRCSLKTADLREANERAALLRAEWVARFALERAAVSSLPVESVTPELRKQLADRIHAALLAGDEQLRDDPVASQRIAADLHRAIHEPMARKLAIGGKYTPPEDLVEPVGPLDGRSESTRQILADLDASTLAHAVTAQAAQRLRTVLPLVQAQAATMGIRLEEDTQGMRELLKEALKAQLTARKDIARRDAGEVVDTPQLLDQAQTSQPTATPVTLRDVFDRWKVAKDRSPDSINTCDRSLALFEATFGTPRLETITRAMGDAFRAHLRTLGLSSKTQHDRMTWVKSLLKYARRDLEAIPRNPWEGLNVTHRTENRRAPWTLVQLQAFFEQPLFTSYTLPKTWRAGGAAAYWVPLLGLFTGARVGELCQLRVRDIEVTDQGAFIRITEDAEGATVKTEAGIRDVPIHSELIRLGFLDYVALMREAGESLLWPAMRFREGKPGGYFSDWFGQYRRGCAVEVRDFHSFRHTVRTAMTEARISEAIQDRITGHEVKGSTGTRVYAHPKAVLREAVESIRYVGLDLPRSFEA